MMMCPFGDKKDQFTQNKNFLRKIINTIGPITFPLYRAKLFKKTTLEEMQSHDDSSVLDPR